MTKKKQNPLIYVMITLIVGVIVLMFISCGNNQESKHEAITNFRSDLYSEIHISSESTEYKKMGNTDNYTFVLSISNVDTFGRYQAKYTGKIEDYHWDNMNDREINLLLTRLKQIKGALT